MTNDTKSRLTEAEHDEMVAAVKSWLPASYGPLVTTLGEWAERLVAEHEKTARNEHNQGCEYLTPPSVVHRLEQRHREANAAEKELAALRKRIEDLIATAEYRRSVFGLVHLHPSSITPGNLRALLDGES